MGHLRALERKGAIERIAGQARTFRILGREEDEGPGACRRMRSRSSTSRFTATSPPATRTASNRPARSGRLQVDVRSAGYSNPPQQLRPPSPRREHGGRENLRGRHGHRRAPRAAGRGHRGRPDRTARPPSSATSRKGPGEPPYLKAENKFYPELYPVTELSVQGGGQGRRPEVCRGSMLERWVLSLGPWELKIAQWLLW